MRSLSTASPRPPGPRGARRALPLALALAACDLPTGFPEWEATWVVPAEEVSLEIESFLPPEVTVVDGPAFRLALDPVRTTTTLSEMCGPACGAIAGVTLPKPAFRFTVEQRIDLPTEVVSGTLAGGGVRVEIRNDLGFDPLRPAPRAFGYLAVSARSGGRLLARDSVPGESRPLRPGTPIVLDLPLAAAAVDGPIDLAITLSSPAGDPVRIDPRGAFGVTTTPAEVRLGEVTVRAVGRAVSTDLVELDFEDVDEAVVDRVRRGALRLAVSNPLGVTGPLALRVSTPTGTIDRSAVLEAGSSELRLEFSGEELRSILGAAPVTLALSGTLSGEGGVVTLRPGTEVEVESRLELVLVPVEGE